MIQKQFPISEDCCHLCIIYSPLKNKLKKLLGTVRAAFFYGSPSSLIALECSLYTSLEMEIHISRAREHKLSQYLPQAIPGTNKQKTNKSHFSRIRNYVMLRSTIPKKSMLFKKNLQTLRQQKTISCSVIH